jgi:DNA-directed RNA polymerase II subunit RPB2
MGKQALGIPITTYNIRADTMLYVMNYTQYPLTSTAPARIFGSCEMPSGINAMVAIMAYSGFNQEDSVMCNQSAIQRGLFMVTSFHSIECLEKKRDSYSFEKIQVPPENSTDISLKEGLPGYFKRKNADYSLLDSNGIVRPKRILKNGKWIGESTYVRKGQVIIGRVVVTSSKSGEETMVDDSVVIQSDEEGSIHSIIQEITPSGHKIVKVVIRVVRYPILGDKVASREAQKGTIGMVYNQEDMPFCENTGLIPDIIVNPLCIPGRMTINMLAEIILGKCCLEEGTYGDVSPWADEKENLSDKLTRKLKEHGMQEMVGNHFMRNGKSGKLLKSKIFMGPTYYQRLKHMVDNKIHARANGNVTMLTRQPLEGRSRDGGLRFGEMERDCMLAHGASAFTTDRLYYASDPFVINVCSNCKIITNSPVECQKCKTQNVVKCKFPFASKLLSQELTSLMLKQQITPDIL